MGEAGGPRHTHVLTTDPQTLSHVIRDSHADT